MGLCSPFVKQRFVHSQDLANKHKEKKGSFLPIKCDLTKDGDIYALFETIKKEYGGVDICINNAGLSYDKSLLGKL